MLEETTKFALCECQTKNRELSEECLKLSKKILTILVGPTPEETKEQRSIDCLKADILSERETLCELCDTLNNIISYLGA